MVRIAPSILSADMAKLGEQVQEVEKAGADFLHIDVMDGHFVPNITIGSLVVESLRPITELTLDVHLMIEKPDLYIEQFANAGADIITVHAETCVHLHRTLAMIKQAGKKAGLALNPSTTPAELEYILPMLDLVLIMTVNPGFGGQQFIAEMLPKIRYVKKLLEKEKNNVFLEVDGGINAHTVTSVVKAGADVLVAGSAVFGSDNLATAISELKRCGIK